MTLQEYVEDEKMKLTAFEMHWIAAHKRDPYQFPEDMLPGDWDEQFDFFTQAQQQNETSS